MHTLRRSLPVARHCTCFARAPRPPIPPPAPAPATHPAPRRRRATRQRALEASLRKRAKERADKAREMHATLVEARKAEFEGTLVCNSSVPRLPHETHTPPPIPTATPCTPQKLREKAVAEEHTLSATRKGAADTLHERTVRHQLHMFDRMESVKEQRRRDEYARMQSLLKMMAAEARMDAEAKERAAMAAERQAHQKKLLVMKAAAEAELERMRVSSDFSGLSKLMEKTAKAVGGSGARRGSSGAMGGGAAAAAGGAGSD
jgi:hypothetical protein